ncbi:MAG TPA: fused MFS/spermidine synthase [Terriglobales bacterium]|nr:fused MFS/spermidine synthase [Terriglobales bacterium]
MPSSTVSTTAATRAALRAERFLPWLLLLFAGSGCAALIYEIVWYQMLELVIGSTAVSLGVLLATFMGGLCIGSLALPRWLARHSHLHPLRIYAGLELATGAFGLAALAYLPLIDRIYLAAAAHGLPSMLLRGFICALSLLPPTILMGASLPAIVEWIESTPRGVAWWGLLYGANIAGAVVGCLGAGFYLLRVFDLAIATLVAAAVNLIVAASSWALAARAPLAAKLTESAAAGDDRRTEVRGRTGVYITIGLSGLTALGAEVVWTRLMGLLLGATVYTFSLILAVFLMGLGAGSAWGAALGRRVRPRAALTWCQLGLAAAVAWTAWMLGDSLPYWPVNPLLSASPWYIFQIDLVRTLWTILPATILWGASFPLALAASAAPGDASGQRVGEVYAANTLGAIVGALAFSLVLIPWIGTQACERVLIVTAAASALFVAGELIEPWRWRAASALAASLVLAVGLAAIVPGVPGELIAYGRRIAINAGQSKILYTGEGRNASIAVSEWSDGAIQFHVSGKVEASTEPFDMRLQRMLGHLPALLHPDLRSVLVVGFGAGVTAGTFVLYPSVQHIQICEMEPLIPPISTEYFREQNYDVKDDPRTTITYDDARHFVLTTAQHFDLITSDPIHPWVKGSATLYSREYFQMVRDHLNPGGIVTQWVPLYESSPEVVKSEIATFFKVFPNGSIWANDINGGGYDVVLMGSNAPMRINVDAMQQELQSPAYARVAASLRDVGFGTAQDLLGTYAGQDQDLAPWLAGAPINRDGNLRLQYLAGLALNLSDENVIYNAMLRYRRFPSNLITGSQQMLAPLQAALQPR